MAFKMKGFSGFQQRDSKIDTSDKDNKKGYDTGNFEEEERKQQLKNTILLNNKEIDISDDYKDVFPKGKEIGGDIVSGLDPKNDRLMDILKSYYSENIKKQEREWLKENDPKRYKKIYIDNKVDPAGNIKKARKKSIQSFEDDFQMSLDLDEKGNPREGGYLAELVDQYTKNMPTYIESDLHKRKYSNK